MSVLNVVSEIIAETIRDKGLETPTLTEDTQLNELGLDSLDWALIIAKLEAKFSYDPFLEGKVEVFPQTLRDLAQYYEGRECS